MAVDWQALRDKYGGNESRQTLNKAISAEFPGARLLLDATAAMSRDIGQRTDRPAEQREAMRRAVEHLTAGAEVLRRAIGDAHQKP